MKKIYPLLLGVMMAMGWQLIYAITYDPVMSCRSAPGQDTYLIKDARSETSIPAVAVENYLQRNFYEECAMVSRLNDRGNLSTIIECSPSKKMLCIEFQGINQKFREIRASKLIGNLPSVDEPPVEEAPFPSEGERWIESN